VLPMRVVGRGQTRLVAIGTSTGGPQALARLMSALPADFPCPIAVALHIPEGYTHSLARRLDQNCPLSVVEAEEGMALEPGMVALAPGGSHLTVQQWAGRLVARVASSRGPRGERLDDGSVYVPSVSRLFDSAAELGPRAMAVVLTGMGDDGLEGARKVRAAGGTILTEAESSCVVYGMPRCVWEAGLATANAPLEGMADLIGRNL
jgi:two-component system chemotaxis response regulator CheB